MSVVLGKASISFALFDSFWKRVSKHWFCLLSLCILQNSRQTKIRVLLLLYFAKHFVYQTLFLSKCHIVHFHLIFKLKLFLVRSFAMQLIIKIPKVTFCTILCFKKIKRDCVTVCYRNYQYECTVYWIFKTLLNQNLVKSALSNAMILYKHISFCCEIFNTLKILKILGIL